MITYAEEKGHRVFNWHYFLYDPKQQTPFGWEEAEALASKWVTCACGTQCRAIPRNERGGADGEPLDSALSFLGLQFVRDIRRRDVSAARHTLQRIEIRSTEILDELST